MIFHVCKCHVPWRAMATSSTGLIMSASIKTLLVLPANSLLTFSSSLLSYLMEPLSFFFFFRSPFVSLARARGTAYSTAGMGYYLLAWHSHTHTQWKQIG